MCSKIQPDTALKMTNSPMNTITLFRMGAFLDRLEDRALDEHRTDERDRDRDKKAIQYDTPALINDQAMKVLNVAISPGQN
ncbi:MAG: hypothetical protein R3E68_22765 [Burkholderiaceae bacterium]